MPQIERDWLKKLWRRFQKTSCLPKKLFISKARTELELLPAYLSEKGVGLTALSLLKFTEASFDVTEPYDVIFFGSPRAVRFFLKHRSISENADIGCVGHKTAQALADHGVVPDFIGEGSIKDTAGSFKKWCGSRNVLFPISDISARTISSEIPKKQVQEVMVYKTQVKEEEIDGHDIYIFTSPSNFRGYLKSNTLPAGATTIAWGHTTACEMERLENSPGFILEKPTEESLCELLDYRILQ